MIIYFGDNEKFRSTLIELITLHSNLHTDLYEKDLFIFLSDAEDKLGIDIRINPEVNLMKARSNVGWKWSTLRCFSSWDKFCMDLPEPEMLETKSGVKAQEIDYGDEYIKISKTELLRELKALDIQVSKLIKKVEGGSF